MTTNRDRVLVAAIDLLADEGIRALTHLRVDDRAGLPRGSTSNVYRTREALLVGVAQHMADSEVPTVAAGFAVATAGELVESLIEVFGFLTTENRRATTARLALYVEAGHDEDVRGALAEGRATIESVILPAFTALGAPDPRFATELIAVCFEGLFLHVLGRHARVDPRPHIAVAVHAGMTTRPEPSRPSGSTG